MIAKMLSEIDPKGDLAKEYYSVAIPYSLKMKEIFTKAAMNYLSKDHHYDFKFATVDVHPKVISKLIAPIAKPM